MTPKSKDYPNVMLSTFGHMRHRVIEAIHTEFTYEEVLKMSAPPWMREAFETTVYNAQPLERGYSSMELVCSERIEFRFGKQHILPNKPVWQGEEVPPALRDKLDEWLTARIKVGIDYGRVEAVLREILQPLPYRPAAAHGVSGDPGDLAEPRRPQAPSGQVRRVQAQDQGPAPAVCAAWLAGGGDRDAGRG